MKCLASPSIASKPGIQILKKTNKRPHIIIITEEHNDQNHAEKNGTTKKESNSKWKVWSETHGLWSSKSFRKMAVSLQWDIVKQNSVFVVLVIDILAKSISDREPVA